MARGKWATASQTDATTVDSGDVEGKLIVRRAALVAAPPTPAVLDCFAGEGHMFERVWGPAAGAYLGMDQRFFRPAGDPAGECWRGNNAVLIRRALARRAWDVVDLDSYANPWPLLRLVLNGARGDHLVVTATCALDRAMRVGSSDFACAIAGASGLRYTGLLTRWYDDVIRWVLAWATEPSGFRVDRARRIRGDHNPQMRYWLLELSRPAQAAPKR